MPGPSKCWISGIIVINDNNNGWEVPQLKGDHVHAGDKRGGLGCKLEYYWWKCHGKSMDTWDKQEWLLPREGRVCLEDLTYFRIILKKNGGCLWFSKMVPSYPRPIYQRYERFTMHLAPKLEIVILAKIFTMGLGSHCFKFYSSSKAIITCITKFHIHMIS